MRARERVKRTTKQNSGDSIHEKSIAREEKGALGQFGLRFRQRIDDTDVS